MEPHDELGHRVVHRTDEGIDLSVVKRSDIDGLRARSVRAEGTGEVRREAVQEHPRAGVEDQGGRNLLVRLYVQSGRGVAPVRSFSGEGVVVQRCHAFTVLHLEVTRDVQRGRVEQDVGPDDCQRFAFGCEEAFVRADQAGQMRTGRMPHQVDAAGVAPVGRDTIVNPSERFGAVLRVNRVLHAVAAGFGGRQAIVDRGVDISVTDEMAHLGADDGSIGFVAAAPAAAMNHDKNRAPGLRRFAFRHVEVEAEQVRVDAVDLGIADIAMYGVRELLGHGGGVLFRGCRTLPPPGVAPRQFSLLDDPVAIAVEPFEQRFPRQFAWCHPAIATTVDAVEPIRE